MKYKILNLVISLFKNNNFMVKKLLNEIDAEYYQKACKRFEEQTRQMALW